MLRPAAFLLLAALLLLPVAAPAQAIKPQTTAHPGPQAQFSGSVADFSSGSFGFGTGFGPGRPSDVLHSTHWLNSLHWPGGSSRKGTIGRPSLVIEAAQPSGVKRIYAL